MSDAARNFDAFPDGLSDLMYPHIEALGRLGSRIVYHAPDLTVSKDPNSGLVMFKVPSVFHDTTSVLIGCGNPNLATSVYDDSASTWKRLSGFMLYREKSRVDELDELQSGVYYELRGLSLETRTALLRAMTMFSNKRVPSCAYLNAHMLASCGFALGGGRELTSVIRPSQLAGLIWQHGLLHNGNPVEMRVVNTSPLEVGDHFVGVWRKELNSPLRLVRKMLKRKKAKVHVAALPVESQRSRDQAEWSGRPVTIWMNRPNLFGVLLTFLWGRHAEFKVAIPGLAHSSELCEPLESFPGKLSWMSKVKKHALFSRPVVAFINRIKNSEFDRYDNVPIDAALEMLSPLAESRQQRVLWNFALVMTDDSYEIRLSPLKNLDPLSADSHLRKFTNWVLAKHVVATGYHAKTVYAGEAWVSRTTDGLVLYVNDNSGTYRPTPQQLEAVRRLFSGLGISVRTAHHAH